ncbi:MAG: hypothetical protein IRZ16_20015 [Myxococcaceae bacterium]|nr:hypothetical protein [Myxococcaceae bacterium]
MPDELTLPNLAPQTYQQLYTALRELIPTFSSNWTDYNDSDPGITLLQLLAYVGEATFYRLDRLPEAAYRNFLLLGAGTPDEGVEQALAAAERAVVRRDGRAVLLGGEPVPLDPERLALLRFLHTTRKTSVGSAELRAWGLRYWQSPSRAVTEEDFARLALTCTATVSPDAPLDRVERVAVSASDERMVVTIASGNTRTYVPLSETQSGRTAPASGAVLARTTLAPRPESSSVDRAYDRLLYAVRAFLLPRLLVGTALEVRRAPWQPVTVTLSVAVLQGYDPKAVVDDVAQAVLAWIHPLEGGPEGKGWPIGRALSDAELVACARRVDGVDPSEPVLAHVAALEGLAVGAATVGVDTVVLAPPAVTGFPLPLRLTVEALSSTWTMQVGAHGRVGIDTRLPMEAAS